MQQIAFRFSLSTDRFGTTNLASLKWRAHMTLKEFWRREIHVALNAQSRRFRAVKWTIILLVSAGLYFWMGPGVVVTALVAGCILGVCLHFFLRWKTDGWTRSWGLYKRIPLDGEQFIS